MCPLARKLWIWNRKLWNHHHFRFHCLHVTVDMDMPHFNMSLPPEASGCDLELPLSAGEFMNHGGPLTGRGGGWRRPSPSVCSTKNIWCLPCRVRRAVPLPNMTHSSVWESATTALVVVWWWRFYRVKIGSKEVTYHLLITCQTPLKSGLWWITFQREFDRW